MPILGPYCLPATSRTLPTLPELASFRQVHNPGRIEWRFDTDRDGSGVQICRCGVAYVAIKAAPKLLRKPTGKHIVPYASSQREATQGDVRRSFWALDPRDTRLGR